MKKVLINQIENSIDTRFRAAGVQTAGAIQSLQVIGDDQPLFLWQHTLSQGAEIKFTAPPVGHALYVLEGTINADGTSVGNRGAVIVEHKGAITIRADAGPAQMLHYHRPDGHPETPSRAGGHCHILSDQGVLRAVDGARNARYTVYADSACPTCEMWLHLSHFGTPRPQTEPHYHTEDEIIFVTRGGMVLGRHTHQPGTALAISANTAYAFGVDQGGVEFLNFRPTDPFVVLKYRDGRPDTLAMSEREYMLNCEALPFAP